ATCKKIRDDGDHWAPLETFIDAHSEAQFSHGLCPECLAESYRKAGLEPPSIGTPT
ncbi:MAG: GGDEF domain-containing protein, partial [bacterium]|nr:GGDEF domain-containing protein [bacterium]